MKQENLLNDERLRKYYSDLEEIVSGPIFSRRRFALIAQMNLGIYDNHIDLGDERKLQYPTLIETSLQSVSDPKPRGLRWDYTRNTVMKNGGILVDLGVLRRNPSLEVSLDLNDTYSIAFLDGETLSGRVTVGPSRSLGGGLEVYILDVPKNAVRTGYSEVHILPVDGDGKYSLGHLMLLDGVSAG